MSGRAQRSAAGLEIPRPCVVATLERVSPPKPRGTENVLRQTSWSTPYGAGLRPRGRRVPESCCRAERLHRARPPPHEGRRISLTGTRGSPHISRSVQQSLSAAETRAANLTRVSIGSAPQAPETSVHPTVTIPADAMRACRREQGSTPSIVCVPGPPEGADHAPHRPLTRRLVFPGRLLQIHWI